MEAARLAWLDADGGLEHAHLDPKEWERILGLPVQLEMDEAQVQNMSYTEFDARAYDSGARLLPLQAWMIREFDAVKGLLAQARVGSGKTLGSLMLCERGARAGIPRQLLLVQTSVYGQLMKHDLPHYRRLVPFSTKFIGLGGMSKAARLDAAKRHRMGCFILPYSLLSREETRQLLDLIDPGIVVGDEAQNLKRRDAARTRRFLDFANARPQCLFAFMSGTLTAKSLKDYHHLARLALRDRSPMPRQVGQATAWAAILDAGAEPTPERCGPLMPLRNWAMKVRGVELPYTVDGVREAYQERLKSAPGCVISQADETDVELRLSVVDPGEPGLALQKMMQAVTQQWIAPTGDEIAHAFHTHKWLYELSMGFYNALVWPEARDERHQKEIDRARQHHAAEQLYTRELRQFLLATSRPNLDTPMLVGRAIYAAVVEGKKAHVPDLLIELWKEARALEFPGMPHRIQIPTRVDDYKIKAIADWCTELKGGGGIVWFHHHEPLDWAFDVLSKTFPNVRTARAGDDALMQRENAGFIYLAAKAHSVGKNLQHFPRQLVAQWPRPAIDAEQLLGRAHRTGIEEFVGEDGAVEVDMLFGPAFDHQIFSACAADALYIQLTTGSQQKIYSATYVNPPRVFDPRLLARLGFQGKMATAAQLEEKFGEVVTR